MDRCAGTETLQGLPSRKMPEEALQGSALLMSCWDLVMSSEGSLGACCATPPSVQAVGVIICHVLIWSSGHQTGKLVGDL